MTIYVPPLLPTCQWLPVASRRDCQTQLIKKITGNVDGTSLYFLSSPGDLNELVKLGSHGVRGKVDTLNGLIPAYLSSHHSCHFTLSSEHSSDLRNIPCWLTPLSPIKLISQPIMFFLPLANLHWTFKTELRCQFFKKSFVASSEWISRASSVTPITLCRVLYHST